MMSSSDMNPDNMEPWVGPDFGEITQGEAVATSQTTEVSNVQGNLSAEWTSGYQAGLSDARLSSEKSKTAESSDVKPLLESLVALNRQLDDAVLQDLVVVALKLTQQILKRELHQDADFYIDRVKLLASHADNASGHIEILMNPEDLDLVCKNLSSSDREKLPSLVSDPSMPRGSCFLETDSCFINAGIQNLIDQLDSHSHLIMMNDE